MSLNLGLGGIPAQKPGDGAESTEYKLIWTSDAEMNNMQEIELYWGNQPRLKMS